MNGMPKTTALAAAVIAAMAVLSPVSDAATRLQKTFGNWQVDCTERDANSPKVCSLQFALVNKNDKQVVFSWTVVRKDAESTTNTPTGVLLADGVSIGFEGTEPVKVNYYTCGPRFCFAEFDFSDQWAKALSSKEKVVVSYKAVNGTPLKHEIDLKQFPEGLAFYAAQLSGKSAE
jgi:invasion protein IalB